MALPTKETEGMLLEAIKAYVNDPAGREQAARFWFENQKRWSELFTATSASPAIPAPDPAIHQQTT